MVIKYYTHQNPPPILAEPVSQLPDECRQSDYVSLEHLFERFMVSGASITNYLGAQSLSAEEKEQLFEQVTEDELQDMDIVEQKAFVDNVFNSVKEVKEPTQPKAEPEQPKADEPKDA